MRYLCTMELIITALAVHKSRWFLFFSGCAHYPVCSNSCSGLKTTRCPACLCLNIIGPTGTLSCVHVRMEIKQMNVR